MLPSIIVSLIACQSEPNQNLITLEWQQGQTFYIASSQREIANHNIESVVSLEDYDPNAILQESWTEESIWTYRVIESDFYPDPSDQLFSVRVWRAILKELSECSKIVIFLETKHGL